MRKVRLAAVVASVGSRIINPAHLLRAVRLQWARKREKRVYQDAQLALVAEFLPGGFLHYGYFDDPNLQPEDISLSDILAAQRRYAGLLIELVDDVAAPVLDVGCGMGTLSGMLLDRGFAPTALTPDRLQARHVEATYPRVPVIRCKFEDLPDPASHVGKYGTIITAESLQYLKLDRALPLLASILKPDGKWIACDYFRTGGDGGEGGTSGHEWDTFCRRIARDGWRIDHERDITPHILPTLRCIHMWASRFGVPFLQFARLKLAAKQPALHYILQDVFQMLDGTIEDNLKIVDPAVFSRNKRYMQLVMRRAA